MAQLEAAFKAQQGEVYKGEGAWKHLEAVAGPTMALFLEKYVRVPIQALLNEVTDSLPDFSAKMSHGKITLALAEDSLVINRSPDEPEDVAEELPEDAAEDQIAGP